MSELEKLDHVKTYIEKLVNGIDPKTNEVISNFPPSEIPIPITEFTRRVNDLILPEAPIKKLCYKRIIQFLIHLGLLTESSDKKGKIVRYPTAAGETLGIKVENRKGIRGPYMVILYNRNAQQFLIDNMTAIVDIKNAPEID